MICCINCDKQHWEIEETSDKGKTAFIGSVPTIFVEECRADDALHTSLSLELEPSL